MSDYEKMLFFVRLLHLEYEAKEAGMESGPRLMIRNGHDSILFRFTTSGKLRKAAR
jgi:hypothetical protein